MNIGLRLYYREQEEYFGLTSHIPGFGYRLLAGTVDLRLRLELLGHRLIPLSQANLESLDVVIVFDIDAQIYQEVLQLPPSIPCILICMESPIYSPHSHDLSILAHPRWRRILTWNRAIRLPNVIYYDIPIADGIPLNTDYSMSTVSQKGVAIANPAKSQRGLPPRRDSLYLDLAAQGIIDLYGNHWPYIPDRGLHGSAQDKIATIEKYSYSLVIENCVCSGYVTEKLADSVLARRPAIYYGDNETAQGRFAGTFILLKELSLESFLESLSELRKYKDELEKSIDVCRQNSFNWCNSFSEEVIKAICECYASPS
ncbi:hypothetical protein H6F46_07690 [Limnothrix sp. FACHB-1083]|uniref:glycosyltransferase family 10 domain-containing protein n=1 Tax=unclassified Limnothrix TaxID=2632864 RepID=UPI001680005A|nr:MULTISPECIES: glycosyltransferase family 10 [unclassified Limnothrix]MBD2160573.1 hypothetical protein [Limnothrix sp. FACHB-1083]MBD2191275.1 hypothetical protein [Limnothrix sp. FACHB-1088]